MLHYLLPLGGIVLAFLIVRFREAIGNIVGEADWMRKVGGVYNLMIIVALVLFFWCLAELTNSTSLLFGPVKDLFPNPAGSAAADNNI